MTQTTPNEFCCYRIYTQPPKKEISNDPQPDYNDFPDSTDVYQGNEEELASGLRMPSLGLPDLTDLLGIFLNTTVALLVNQFYSRTLLKSLTDVQSLVNDIILHKDFNPDDLRGVKINTEIKKLDVFESSREGIGWKEDTLGARAYGN